jgi:hypothetical protein
MTHSLPFLSRFALRALSLLVMLSSSLLAQAQLKAPPVTTIGQIRQPGGPAMSLPPTAHQPLPAPTPAQSARLMAPAASTIRYVKAGASGNGASWSNASGDLQAMINASTTGDQVWIAGGTYKPTTAGLANSRTAAFSLKNGVSVLGGFSGAAGSEGNVTARTAMPSSTTLSGDVGQVGSSSDNCYHVVSNYGNGLNETAILDGVTLTAGRADGPNDGSLSNNGGGMLNALSSPTVVNCLFVANFATTGGGLADLANTARATNCVFSQNSAELGAGGVYGQDNSGTYTNCFFDRNFSTNPSYTGGAIFGAGSVNLVNCTFAGNRVPSGGYAIGFSRAITLTNCLFWDNGGSRSIANLGGSATIRYSLLEAGTAGYTDGGNNQTLTSSPFANATGPQLLSCTPAVDAGDNTANTTTTDVLGNARRVRTIDIGAAEFQGTPTQPIAITQQPVSGSSVCAGASVRVAVSASGTSPSFQWYKDGQVVSGHTAATLALSNLQTGQSGNYVVVISGCNSVTSTAFRLTVTAPFSVGLTTNGPLTCVQKSVTLTTTGGPTGASYAYSPGAQASSPGSLTAAVSQAGPYSVTVTVPGGCSATATTTVTSNTVIPTVVVTPSSQTICSGQTAVFSASGADTYRWSNGANTGAIAANVSGFYSVTATQTSTGCTATAAGQLTVLPTPTLSLDNARTSSFSRCDTPNGQIGFTTNVAAGEYSVSYRTSALSGVQTRIVTVTDSRFVLTGLSGASYYGFGLTSGSCTGTTSVTVTLTGPVPPSVTIQPSAQRICQGQTASLVATGAAGYRWSTGATTASISASVSGTYSVTGSTSNGCSATATATLTVNAAPAASLASSGPLSCSVTSATLTASPDGESYQFSDGATPIGTTNQATVTMAGIYSVTVLAGNGCSSVASATMTANQMLPTVSISPSSTTLTCADPSATLTAVGSGSFRWNTGAQTASISATTAGTYSVTVTGSNGCSATTSALVSSDQTAPSATITPTSGTLTCATPTLTLTANSSAPNLRWSNGQTTPSITVNAAGDYSVTATGANGCLATSNAVRIEAAQEVPPATLVASGGLSCAVTSVTLTANSGDGLTYRFSPGATQVGSDNTATVNASGTYSVTVTNTATGCANTASVVVGQDNSQPTVSISPTTATLSCGAPTATLTANTSASSLRWSTGPTTASISVNVAGTYSVTVTSSNGCQAVAQATVSGTTDAPTVPTLAASPATTTADQPITVTASGCTGGTITWTALGGTGQASGNTYTLTQPGNYTLSASCSLNGCTSISSAPLALQIRPGGFAITGVSMVNCELIDEAKGGYRVQFTPQYTGQTSSPISFSVVNELATTTAPAPYSLRLYTDNPVITLVAAQAGNGEARFAYNWRASCQSGTSPNRPPTTPGIPNQTIVQGQAYQLQLSSYFTDPDGQTLTFQASGLPAGLSLTGSVISGTPARTGVATVNVTAIDPGGLQASTSFQLTVSPMPTTPPSGFTIVGVSTVSCQVIGAGERQLTFTPQYAGVSGEPISFSVVNELRPTTEPGPYTLRLYTDNPAITLSTQQGSAVSTYRYNWLAVCNPTGRVGLREAESALVVRVLGNPLTGDAVEVEVQGAQGQPVQVRLTDLQGQLVSERSIQQAGPVESLRLPMASQPAGVLLLRVSTLSQSQTLKVLKP